MQTRVEQIMRRDFASVHPEESLESARQTMRLGRVRHLPVTRAGALLGLLSYRDLLESLLADGDGFARGRVRDAMRAAPACVTPENALVEAADPMCRYGLGCLPVLDGEGLLVGLLSETDLLRAAFGLPAP